MTTKRPPVRIRFKYNVDTGDIEEFIIDDNAVTASEDYHDKVARSIAGRLGREPDIIDAGPIRLLQTEPQPAVGIQKGNVEVEQPNEKSEQTS